MKHFYFPFVALGAVVWVSTGCRPSTEDAALDQDEAPRTAQITVWTDRYEVFAEHRAPVAGKATTFITHVTDLRTQEPRREGTVKFVLRSGDTVVDHPQAAPARAGIYLPGIIFPEAGDWDLTLLVPSDGTNVTVPLGMVRVYADPAGAERAEIPDAPEGVSFLKEQQWKILAKTEPAEQHHLVERVRAAARVRAKPGSSATVVAPLSGQLVAPPGGTSPQPGLRVEAGQLLALLQPTFSETAARVAEADAGFATAKAEFDQAESAYARTKKLAAEQAKSPRELQEAELAYQSAKARYGAAAGLLATFKQSGGVTSAEGPLLVELRAPVAGVLNAMTAGPGEVVSANQPLFTVLNPESVWIEARIPEASVGRLSAGKDALVELPDRSGPSAPMIREGVGKLVSLGLEVNVATRTVPLIYELKNTDGLLRIGQSVDLLVETAQVERALAIPGTAIVEEDGRPIAFVQISGETFEKRDLTLGIRDGHWVQVLEGITEGERVVTRGAYAVRLASVSSAIPAHGHVH
jgi:RND family efflux transporter MFP subunit